MYIFKNALRNIVRSKGRNILIGLIVLVIATASCLALSIREAASSARESGLENLQITAQITMDRQAMMQGVQKSGGDMGNMKDMLQKASQGLTLEEMQTYASSSYVKEFLYTITTSLNGSDSIEPVETSTASSGSGHENPQMYGGDFPGGDMPEGGKELPAGMGNMGDFTLIGYSAHSAMTAFVNGTCQITSGSVFEEKAADPVCVISDELATLNGLAVGDTLTLINPNDEEETVTLTVAGLYHNSEAGSTGSGMMRGFSAASDPANQIYMSYTALKTIVEESATRAETTTDEETGVISTSAMRQQVSGSYTFADAAAYEGFQTEVAAMGLPEGYTVTSSDLTQYEQSLVPLENLSKFATVFFLVVLGIGGVILVVFLIFNIRERKYEIGVLTAIGMNKGKVALQFTAELFTVTFAFLIMGTAVGAVVSVPATNALLSTQIASQQNQQDTINRNFGRPGAQNTGDQGEGQMPGHVDATSGFGGMGRQMASYISEVTSATDFTVVAQLLGIGVLLTLVSSGVAVTFVLRYEPLKILSERT